MNVYKAIVSTDLKGPMREEFYLPANSMTEAVTLIEEGRHQFFEGQPLHVMSIEQMTGKWLLPKEKNKL